MFGMDHDIKTHSRSLSLFSSSHLALWDCGRIKSEFLVPDNVTVGFSVWQESQFYNIWKYFLRKTRTINSDPKKTRTTNSDPKKLEP